MKNRALIFAAAFIFLASLPAVAQDLGEKIYKEVTVEGEQLYKWVEYYSITEYDSNGNEIHYKDSYGYEKWYEYDSNGNEIHYKSSDGCEWWYEYDSKGNQIHYKTSKGYECWYEYTFYPNGNVKTEKAYSTF
jgi:YD repeat-containing protein